MHITYAVRTLCIRAYGIQQLHPSIDLNPQNSAYVMCACAAAPPWSARHEGFRHGTRRRGRDRRAGQRPSRPCPTALLATPTAVRCLRQSRWLRPPTTWTRPRRPRRPPERETKPAPSVLSPGADVAGAGPVPARTRLSQTDAVSVSRHKRPGRAIRPAGRGQRCALRRIALTPSSKPMRVVQTNVSGGLWYTDASVAMLSSSVSSSAGSSCGKYGARTHTHSPRTRIGACAHAVAQQGS